MFSGDWLWSSSDIYWSSELFLFHIYFRAGALKDASEQIKSLEVKLDSTVARNQAEKQAWEEDLRVLEETWRRN